MTESTMTLHPHRKDQGGVEEWRDEEGRLHRLDGPARTCSEGLQEWFVQGKYHRLDGPAYINAGTQWWYVNDVLHRIDGPAGIFRRGRAIHFEWRVYGYKVGDQVRQFCGDHGIRRRYGNWTPGQNFVVSVFLRDLAAELKP